MKQKFEIAKLVDDVYQSYSFAAAQKGLRYTFSLSHKLPKSFHGDSESIKKALSAIVQMAIEDSSSGGVQINVDLLSQSDSSQIVKFSVVETSKGFPYWFSVSLEKVSSKKTA